MSQDQRKKEEESLFEKESIEETLDYEEDSDFLSERQPCTCGCTSCEGLGLSIDGENNLQKCCAPCLSHRIKSSSFNRSLLLAIRCLTSSITVDDTFHLAFDDMCRLIDNMSIPIDIEYGFDPVFGIHNDALAMVFDGERDFILTNHANKKVFKISKEYAKDMLYKHRAADIYLFLAKILINKL